MKLTFDSHLLTVSSRLCSTQLSNAKLQEKLFGLEGAAELLVLVGFTQVWKPEEIFFFPPEALLSPLQELYTQLDGELAALFDSA